MKFNQVMLVAVAMSLAACGSATDAVTFIAPPHFESKASVGPFMQMWTGPDGQTLMLMAIPGTGGDLSDAFKKTNGNMTLDSRQAITICSSQDAMLATGTGKPSAGGPPNEKFELLATRTGGKTYLAMYGRPFKAPADPAAEKAIKNVCPK